MTYELERIVLRSFYEDIRDVGPIDGSISDSKLVKTAQSKLKAALKDVDHKCTCAKRTWGGPCELCQASDRAVYFLRNFFRVIRDAKKRNMTENEIQEFVQNAKGDLQ